MSDQEKLLRRIRASQFAEWELHIFLDTHPNDCDAAKKLAEYQEKMAALVKGYEQQYGPLNETSGNTSRWAWITGPWPWELGEEDDG